MRLFRRNPGFSMVILGIGMSLAVVWLHDRRTSTHQLPVPWSEVTFDCGDDEDGPDALWRPAENLRLAGGLKNITEMQSSDVFRFTLQRAFDSPVVMTLVINRDGDGDLRLLVWDRSPLVSIEGLPDGKIIIDSRTDVPKTQVDDLVLALTSEQFWLLPNYPCKVLSTDGSNWTIEGLMDGKYQFAYRRNPNTDNPIRIIGEKFIELSNENFGRIY